MLMQTKWHFRTSPDLIWPLLCKSKMDEAQSCLFRLGVPKPVECRLASDQGGVGATRECVSNQGVVQQEIMVWEVERQLSFKLKQTDIFFRKFISGIVELSKWNLQSTVALL